MFLGILGNILGFLNHLPLGDSRIPCQTRWILVHRNILLLVIGGRESMIPSKARTIPGIQALDNCQLGEYMLPTTFYKNLKNQLIGV